MLDTLHLLPPSPSPHSFPHHLPYFHQINPHIIIQPSKTLCSNQIIYSKFAPTTSPKHNTRFLQQLQAAPPSLLRTKQDISLPLSESGVFYLPDISSSLPLKLHRNYDVVKDTVDDWVLSAIANSKSEMDIELIRQWNVPLAMCLCNPEAKMGKLILATQLMVWMGLADDLLDECVSEGRQNISARTICSILDGTVDPSDVQGTCMEALFHLWQHLRSDMPINQRQRFAQSMKECMKALNTVNYLRQKKISPSIDEYVQLRRLNGGVYPMFILQEFALGIEKKDRDSAHQSYAFLVKQLEAAAADHVVWVNDLLSFRKEYFKGYVFNMPALLCTCDKCDLQEAVYKMCSMIETKEREFIGLRKLLMETDVVKKEGPELMRYVDSLAYFMSGNIHWSFITARYHGLNNIPKYRHGLFELRPDITVIRPLCPSQLNQIERERELLL